MSDIIVARLGRLCTKWGGALKQVSEEEYGVWMMKRFTYSEAPFSSRSIGVSWKRKWIIYSGEIVWTDLTHEMGHVFASAKPPEISDEFLFFGWEYRLTRYVRAPVAVWKESNKHYGVDERGTDLGSLNAREVRVLLRERVKIAQDAGLLDGQQRPLAIR